MLERRVDKETMDGVGMNGWKRRVRTERVLEKRFGKERVWERRV